MEIVYICEQNSTIHKSGETMVVRKNDHKIAEIPLINVSTIVIVGNIQITTQVLQMLFNKLIDVIFMSRNGKLLGRINSEKSCNTILKIAQFNKWNDDNFKLKLSKSFASMKIQNQIKLLEKYYSYNSSEELKANSNYLKNYCSRIKDCTSISEIMGLEGICAKKYFESFNYILKYHEFSSRQRRPAYDVVNSLLNLGYAFLKNEINIRLNLYSFDTELGFMHGIRYGRESLSLDLMEEFRPLFIDNFTIKLLNKKILKSEHFEISEEGCILTKDGMTKYIEAYHNNLNKDNINWPIVFDSQIKKFRKVILEGGEYTAFKKK